MLAVLWTSAMFFLELLDLQNVGLTIMCHDKTRQQIIELWGSVNWQKPKLIIGKSQVHQACILCVLF